MTCRSWPVAALVLALAACSPTTAGMNRMADALTSTADAYARDDDPEFVRVAAPSTLKMIEMLLESQPRHPGLLLTACRGFTQYAYGFLQVDAEILEPTDKTAAADLNVRALKMYERARDYCTRALEARFAGPGAAAALRKDARAVLSRARRAEVPALYWTAAAWGGILGLTTNPLQRLADLAVVRALLSRALELDEGWERGAIHEAMIAVDGLPALLGGSPARARKHFERAVELSGGESAFAYVTMAASVAVPARDRAEFEKLLRTALAVEAGRRPESRLVNLIAQRRAKFLLSRAPELFR